MTEQEASKRAQEWLDESYDQHTRREVEELIKTGGEALIDAFYKDMDFGTGGMRGVMGVGSNRINRYTLGMATQGLSNYLHAQFPGEELRVAIAHDSRHHARHFSIEVAKVLAANKIDVYLYDALRPTPALSFAVRHLQCQSGIVITASHNPPEYNGYKVYWQDGGQLVPPHDQGVIEEVRRLKPSDVLFESSEKSSRIHIIGEEVDQAFLEQVKALSFGPVGQENLSVVFTSIHGTSITLMPPAFEHAGFKQFHIVHEQSTPDGDFPSVKSPNPEEPEALDMALQLAEKKKADMVIGTDPDGDRVGIAVRNLEGEMELLNGNQAAAVLIYYLLERKKEKGSLPANGFIGKTIVTSDLLSRIAEGYQIPCYECLTGFKWIAKMIREREGKEIFIGGGEESYGYLIGDFVRDKDAISSAVMLAEAAAYANSQGSSLYEMLIDVYQRFGLYREKLISITKKGAKGAEEINKLMHDFRAQTPAQLAGEKVLSVLDYHSGEAHHISSGRKEKIDMPRSNVVQIITEAGSKITARPSGTEPKIKFYISVHAPLENKQNFAARKNELDQHIDQIVGDLGIK